MNRSIHYEWSYEKNEKLIRERGVSFEEIVFHIDRGDVLDVVDNPRYPNQRVYIIRIGDYAYRVPFVQSEYSVYLITIYPSRKATRDYIYSRREEHEQGGDTT